MPTKKVNESFRELCETLKCKKPRIAKAMCKVDLPVPTRRGNSPSVLYPFLRCGRTIAVSASKLNPCRKQIGKKASQLAFQTAFYGRHKAKNGQKAKKAAPSQSAEATRKCWHAVKKFECNRRLAE